MDANTHTSTLYATELRLRSATLAMHLASAAAVTAALLATRGSVVALAATIPVLSNQLYLHTHDGRTTVGMIPPSIVATGLAALAVLVKLQLPPIARAFCIFAAATAAVVTTVLAFWFIRIRSCYRRHPTLEPDATLIVLGGAIRNGHPCRTLAQRLDIAARYGLEHPGIIIVPTGGPTPDHTTTEAEVMAHYLQERGIESKRILPETTALNTRQNIENACTLLDARNVHTQRCVVSSDYHLWRALRDARAIGVELTPIPAPTPVAGRAQQWCREVLTILASR